jgi:hypothetical protein
MCTVPDLGDNVGGHKTSSPALVERAFKQGRQKMYKENM